MNRNNLLTAFIYTLLVFQLVVAYFAYKEVKSYNERMTSCYELLGLGGNYQTILPAMMSEMGLNTSYNQISINTTSTTR